MWKPIKGYPKYYISDDGRVASFKRGELNYLKLRINKKGYYCVGLYHERRLHAKFTHRLVAQAYIGECPLGKQVNHKDMNKANNHVSNLEYVTMLENLKHSRKNRTYNMAKGANHYRAKLTDKIVRDIRARYSSTRISYRELAKEYGVKKNAIQKIIQRTTWKHVTDEPDKIKVVINSCIGGYSLSEEAYKYLGLEWDRWGNAYYHDRSNPDLVKCVKELGERANGRMAKLKIVEIPSNIEWYINEGNGEEWIAEKHRTWY